MVKKAKKKPPVITVLMVRLNDSALSQDVLTNPSRTKPVNHFLSKFWVPIGRNVALLFPVYDLENTGTHALRVCHSRMMAALHDSRSCSHVCLSVTRKTQPRLMSGQSHVTAIWMMFAESGIYNVYSGSGQVHSCVLTGHIQEKACWTCPSA